MLVPDRANTAPDMTSFVLAVEQFDDEEYEAAIVSLTEALEETDDNKFKGKILGKRASAYLRAANPVFEKAAEDAAANYRRDANDDTPLQTTIVCRTCGTKNPTDGLCSRCHNPLSQQAADRNMTQLHEFAQINSTDSVEVRVHDGSQGNRGQHRSRTPAALEHDRDMRFRTRFRRLGFTCGTDMVNETNYTHVDGSTNPPPDWYAKMADQREKDRQKGRDYAFYQAVDARLAAHVNAHMPMSRTDRMQQFGGFMSVRPAPGAQPLDRQRDRAFWQLVLGCTGVRSGEDLSLDNARLSEERGRLRQARGHDARRRPGGSRRYCGCRRRDCQYLRVYRRSAD